MKKKNIFYIFSLIFCLISQIKTMAQQALPEAPKEHYLQDTVLLQKHLSTINIPLDIAMEDIEKQINNNVTGLIYEDNSYTDNDNDNFKCNVWKKDKIIITNAVNDVFSFTVPLRIWAEKGISVFGFTQYQSTEFQVDMKFVTKFNVNPDWSVSTQTTPNGFDWVTKPSIKIAGIDVSISAIIGKIISNQHSRVARLLDESVAKNMNFKPYIIKAWNAALPPFQASEEYKTWVKITPLEIQMTPLKAVGRNVLASLGLKAYTESITGMKPITPLPVKTVPNLKIVQNIPNDFEVALMSDVPYEEATAVAKKTFIGQKYDFKNGKYKVEITDIDIYGSNDLLVIKADMKGSMTGSIYLKGKPIYDSTQHKIVLTNLDYDLKTRNVLLKVGNWFLEGKIVKMMQEQFGMPVDELISYAKENIESAMNTEYLKGVKVSGKIEKVIPDKVYLTPSGIVAVVFAKGKLDLKVKGL